jgi:hypothetical protein
MRGEKMMLQGMRKDEVWILNELGKIKQNKGVANIYGGSKGYINRYLKAWDMYQRKKLCFNLISNFRPQFYAEEEKIQMNNESSYT